MEAFEQLMDDAQARVAASKTDAAEKKAAVETAAVVAPEKVKGAEKKKKIGDQPLDLLVDNVTGFEEHRGRHARYTTMADTPTSPGACKVPVTIFKHLSVNDAAMTTVDYGV